MKSTSETPLQPGSMKYGRNLILVWNVIETEDGYEYDSLGVPKHSSEAEISSALDASGIDIGTIKDILQFLDQDATGVGVTGG